MERKKPKLLLVVNEPLFFLTHRKNIALEAKRRGWELVVCGPDEPLRAEVQALGIRYQEYSISKWSLNPLKDLRSVYALYRLYKEERPNLVHHVSIKPVLYGSIAARLAGIPAVVNAVSGLGFIFVSQGTVASLRRAIIKLLYKLAHTHPNQRVIVQNEDDRQLFLEHQLVPEAKLRKIRGSGVSEQLFRPTPEPAGEVTVLMVSRILRDKGVREFVEAARKIKSTHRGVRFELVGDRPAGNPAAISRDEFEAWQQEGIVDFLGFKDDISEAYRNAHIVCLPSYREGLPRSLIEAAASGKPLVATDVPGCREIATEGVNAVLVPAKDSASLAGALIRLIERPSLRAQYGAKSREKFLEGGFSERAVVEQTFLLYEELGCVEAQDSRKERVSVSM